MPGAKSNITTVEIRYIADDDTRINSFIAGDLDVCAVPRAKMFRILDNATKLPAYADIESIAFIRPALSMDAMHFTFLISNTTLYGGTGSFPGGIPADFYNNTHVRKAFAYGFNWSNYLRDAYYSEGGYRQNIFIDGLAPDYYDVTGLAGYFESLANAKTELQAAIFNATSVWDSGFTLTLAYNTGNTQRQIACQQLANFFATLSTYGGRVGPAFTVNVINIDWNVYLDNFENMELPIFSIGWLADFSDADNFVRPYMHSDGDFSYFQSYWASNGWPGIGATTGLSKDVLIDLAIKTPDGPLRAQYYKDLQKTYYDDVPSFPLITPYGRRFCKYWVKGWYYDALYPSQYYYSMWKENTCWYDVAGAQLAGQPGISDGITNIKDITYEILHFNARPPDPNFQDPKWVGTYGNGGVDPGPGGGDRICNIKDITFAILHFQHTTQP
jgi:peptide/nickel transport system substrate-binding protein